MTQHTAGPWIAAAAPSSVVGWPIVSREGRSICNLTWFAHSTVPTLTDAQYADFRAEVAANARLIAAAPKMLAALKKICEPITVAADAETLSACQDLHELISEIAQEAIAEASSE